MSGVPAASITLRTVTHPADAADRIDRSCLPRGEGEERELVISFSDQ
jgi:hypothetical protein